MGCCTIRSPGKWLTCQNKWSDLVVYGLIMYVQQAAINETQTYEGMLEGVEKVSSLITRYAMVEDMDLRKSSSSLEKQLSNALICRYTSILVFLAKSRKYFSRNTGGQLLDTTWGLKRC